MKNVACQEITNLGQLLRDKIQREHLKVLIMEELLLTAYKNGCKVQGTGIFDQHGSFICRLDWPEHRYPTIPTREQIEAKRMP